MVSFNELKQKVLAFRDARDWRQFHDPKNLAEGLSVEAGELLENFLWKTVDESKQIDETQRERIADELGDVFVFLIYLAEELGIDLLETTDRKVDKNAEKYPVDKVRGNSTKYHDL